MSPGAEDPWKEGGNTSNVAEILDRKASVQIMVRVNWAIFGDLAYSHRDQWRKVCFRRPVIKKNTAWRYYRKQERPAQRVASGFEIPTAGGAALLLLFRATPKS